ncbi:unnamed protein product, partial [Iphiclides podalirius]
MSSVTNNSQRSMVIFLFLKLFAVSMWTCDGKIRTLLRAVFKNFRVSLQMDVYHQLMCRATLFTCSALVRS